MKVLPCNTPVGLAGSSLRGNILAVCIRGALVTYEVVWFVGDTRHAAWLQESEITAAANVRRMGL